MTEWSEGKCAGFALAGLIAGDRTLAAADAAIAPVALRTRAQIAHDGAAREAGARRQLVEGLLAAVRPPISLAEDLPARLRALLATRLSRAERRALGSPALREGYTVPDDLWPRLYRIARYHRAGKP
jgi:hypothetical protein